MEQNIDKGSKIGESRRAEKQPKEDCGARVPDLLKKQIRKRNAKRG